MLLAAGSAGAGAVPKTMLAAQTALHDRMSTTPPETNSYPPPLLLAAELQSSSAENKAAKLQFS